VRTSRPRVHLDFQGCGRSWEAHGFTGCARTTNPCATVEERPFRARGRAPFRARGRAAFRARGRAAFRARGRAALRARGRAAFRARGRAALQGRVKRGKSIWALALVVVVASPGHIIPQPLQSCRFKQRRMRALAPEATACICDRNHMTLISPGVQFLESRIRESASEKRFDRATH